MRRALLIMAKRPSAGQTKTRLCPPLSPAAAARLYECFLKDTIESARMLPGVTPMIAYAPPSAESYFRQLAPDFELLPQQGKTLNQRLDHVMTQCSQAGYDQVIAVDSDSPTLPSDYVADAFVRLDHDHIDVAIGPCEDGGYYLIGWKRPNSRLVRDVQMSTSSVVEDTLVIAAAEGLKVTQLPLWYDVDSHQDLIRLKQELAANPNLGRHTRRVMAEITPEQLGLASAAK